MALYPWHNSQNKIIATEVIEKVNNCFNRFIVIVNDLNIDSNSFPHEDGPIIIVNQAPLATNDSKKCPPFNKPKGRLYDKPNQTTKQNQFVMRNDKHLLNGPNKSNHMPPNRIIS